MKAMKKNSGTLKLDLAQYRELAAFSQFASDLDEGTRKQLERGARVTALMTQKQYSPLKTGELAFTLFAANEGFLDDVEVAKVGDFETAMLSYIRTEKTDFLDSLNKSGDYSEEIASEMKSTLEDFKSKGVW